LVVDRRSAFCTTCRAPLPADWIMAPEQAAKIAAIDQGARAEHAEALKMISNAPYTLPVNMP